MHSQLVKHSFSWSPHHSGTYLTCFSASFPQQKWLCYISSFDHRFWNSYTSFCLSQIALTSALIPPRSWQLSNTNFLHLINEIFFYLSFSLWMKLLNSMEFIMFSWADSNPSSFVFYVWFFSFMLWTGTYSLLMRSPSIL